MTAARFTLEILTAPEELKFATSITLWQRSHKETFRFQVIPKQMSSPTHFSLCWRWGCPGTPLPSQRAAWVHPDFATEEGKWRFRWLRWGWAWCPSFSIAGFRIQRWKPRRFGDTAPTGHLGHSSWWGNKPSSFPQAKENPARLSVLVVIWPSFCSDSAPLEICPSFAKEEPEPKRSEDVRTWRAVVRHVNDSSCHCGIQTAVPNWKSESRAKLFILFGAFVILCMLSH